MRRAKVVLLAVMTIPLAGCLLSGKPKTVAAAPAPPKPAAPTPPPEPLSIPQTNVYLPPPQPPVDPDALVPARQVELATPAQPKPAAATPRNHANTPPSTKTPDPPQVAEPEQPARPPIQEILPADVQKQLRDSAHDHQMKTRALLAGAKPHTNNQRRAVAEIEQFLKQSEQAENNGDMRLADQLSERAYILAKELQGGK